MASTFRVTMCNTRDGFREEAVDPEVPEDSLDAYLTDARTRWAEVTSTTGAWDVSGTTTRTAAGHLGFWAGTDAAAASQTAQVDDIAVTLPGASSGTGGAAETVTADLTAIYTAAKA